MIVDVIRELFLACLYVEIIDYADIQRDWWVAV